MKKFWIQSFNLFIIISIIFKAFQTFDRVFNIVILNLYKHNPNKYQILVRFISNELKIETIARYIIYIIFIILFSGWIYLQYKEAWKVSKIRLTYKPIWGLFSFIIPLFNLVAPYKIMNDLWLVFNKDMSIEDEGKKLIKTWWFLSIALFVFNRYLSIKFETATNHNDFLTAEYFYLVLYAVSTHYYVTVRKLTNSINNSKLF
jgi:hypothetical protein